MNLKTNMPKIDLNAQDWNEVCHILKIHIPDYPVWAFGSRVKWTAKAYSDLDLAIITRQPLSLSAMATIKEAFEESNLSIRVDIVDWAATSEEFRKIIEQHKVIVQKGKKGSEAIGSKWILTSIDELKASTPGSIAIGPFGSRMKSDCYVPIGVRVVRGTNLMECRKFSGEFVFITEEKAKELGNSNLQPNDIVFPHRGSIGEVGIVPDDGKHYVLSSSLLKLSCDTTKAAPLFIYYFFKSSLGRFELLKNASQVGTPGIGQPLTSLKAIKLRLPPIKEQLGVVGILAGLDDRIALLRETNATLEAIAQALFKSWFVDFDPVHAKQQGREPEGLDADTVALFPDSFEESVVGLIPKGWFVRSLDETAEFLNGLALQKFPPEEHSWLPVIKIAQLRKGDTVGADRAGRNLKPEYVIQDGDVLFSWSGSLEVEIWCGGEGALNQHLFKITSKEYPKWFFFLWTIHRLEFFRSIAANKATTMGHIQRKHLSDAKVITPSIEFVETIGDYFVPLIENLISNSIQAQTLTTLRDTLLPRLISGQLRLPDAEALLEETTV
jgi:type I restriction enzyme S subunit